jgi:hypothetical protein
MMSTGELRVTLPFSLSEDEAKLLLAVKVYEVGKISLGQAVRRPFPLNASWTRS